MSTWNCKTVIVFGPGITPHCPAAPWWDVSRMTSFQLGWWIFAALIAAIALGRVSGWIRSRWETGPGCRIARRWYGTGSAVRLLDEHGTPGTALYEVLDWRGDHTPVPWLLVASADGSPPWFRDDDGNVTPMGEDPDAFWIPFTACAPGRPAMAQERAS